MRERLGWTLFAVSVVALLASMFRHQPRPRTVECWIEDGERVLTCAGPDGELLPHGTVEIPVRFDPDVCPSNKRYRLLANGRPE